MFGAVVSGAHRLGFQPTSVCAMAYRDDDVDDISENEDIAVAMIALGRGFRLLLQPFFYNESASSSEEEDCDMPDMPHSPTYRTLVVWRVSIQHAFAKVLCCSKERHFAVNGLKVSECSNCPEKNTNQPNLPSTQNTETRHTVNTNVNVFYAKL